MSPGLEGCLTAGVVGLALALAGGAGYLATALLALPILAQIFRRRRVERVIRADSLASRGLSWYLGNQLGEVAEWLKAHAC